MTIEEGLKDVTNATDVIEGVDDPKTFSAEYVKELRQEAANYRTKLREAETRVDTAKTEYQAQYVDRTINNELRVLAVEENIVDTDVVLALLDKNKVTVDDNGNVTGIKEAVLDLLDAKPWLRKTLVTQVGAGSNPVDTSDKPKTFTRQQVSKMSSQDINKHWDVISKLMAEGKL